MNWKLKILSKFINKIVIFWQNQEQKYYIKEIGELQFLVI